MRKLIMWNLITLDGYFEGVKNWDLPFGTNGFGARNSSNSPSSS